MTIYKAMYKFQAFLLKYADLTEDDEDKFQQAMLTYFGKDTTKLELKLEIALTLGYFEYNENATTVGECYSLTEKGAEYLKKREDVQLKWLYGLIGTLVGSTTVGLIEIIKYLVERFANGG